MFRGHQTINTNSGATKVMNSDIDPKLPSEVKSIPVRRVFLAQRSCVFRVALEALALVPLPPACKFRDVSRHHQAARHLRTFEIHRPGHSSANARCPLCATTGHSRGKRPTPWLTYAPRNLRPAWSPSRRLAPWSRVLWFPPVLGSAAGLAAVRDPVSSRPGVIRRSSYSIVPDPLR